MRTLIVDAGNIRLNAKLIGQIFGIPSDDDEFSSQEDKNLAHVTIKRQFHIRTTTELRDFVYNCPMKAELDRMEFRRYFILVVLYFQWLKHGQLDNGHELEPWLIAWTAEKLEKKATYILFEDTIPVVL
ncbi:uncharacterized protein DS421_9g274920 [Arachis hypogaea]|nr:uncharacterized protein DS421_9g274920 [Arachis hypogaea]